MACIGTPIRGSTEGTSERIGVDDEPTDSKVNEGVLISAGSNPEASFWGAASEGAAAFVAGGTVSPG